MIDDADNARVHGRLDRKERKARLFAAHEENSLPDARTRGVNSHERASGVGAVWRDRLHDEQLDAYEAVVLAGDDDVADDASQMH